MKSWFLTTTGSDSVNRKIFRGAVVVGILTLLAKSGATIKELSVARAFGRSDALDAFLIAFLLPSFGVGLLMNAFGSALIPTFVATRQLKGAEAAQKLFSSVMFIGLVILVAMAILLALLAPYYLPYLGSGFSAEKLRLTRELLYALLPFVVFNGVAACASAILNANEKFALPAMVPLVTSLLTILFIALAAGAWGAFSLVGGVVGGSILEAALLVRGLKAQGTPFSARWNGLDSGVRSVLGQFAPMLGAGFLIGGTIIVDQSMAAMLPAGSVAALGYGNRITSVVLAIGASALGTAAFPYLSKMVAQNDWNGVRHTLKRYSTLVMVASVPFTVFLIAFSRPLVELVFQRGAFSSADTDLVSRVQIGYAIQVPLYIIGVLYLKFLSSIRRNDLLLYCSAIILVLDIALNLALMRVMGVAGIALSTSLCCVFWSLFLSMYSIRLLGRASISVPAPAPAQGQSGT